MKSSDDILRIAGTFRKRWHFLFSQLGLALGSLLGMLALENSAPAQIAPAPDGISQVPVKLDDVTLARKLRNPITSLVNIPLMENIDFGGGPNDNATRSTLNIEPIVPFVLDAHWKIVSRLTLPVIDQRNVIPGTSQDGLGDTVERLLLAPAKANAFGLNWGAGPAFLLPTATNSALGWDRWGAGPAAALNWHQESWTASVLAYQLFSVAVGGSHCVDTVTIQPAVSYVFPTSTTLTLSADSVYDWRSAQYTCPLSVTTYQLVKMWGEPVNLGAGVRYDVARPAGAAEWGLRCSVTFLFPMPP